MQRALSTSARKATQTRLAPLAARSLFTIVHQGHEAWRLSLGRNPTRLTPGLALMIPIYHTVQEVDLRETSINIKDLTGFTSDNVPVVVSGSLFFRVRDSYNACFAVSEYRDNVRNVGTSAIRSVVGHFTYDDIIGDRSKINVKLHEAIGNNIEKWGIDCTKFEVQNFHPSNREVEKQLELQMQAERERRKQILDTQAMVNVAEGHKQRSILESEGELQSQLNRAQGERQRKILESEGDLTAAVNQGRALAEVVDALAERLAGSDAKPTPELRLRALNALVELRRIEQLQAIARGPGNSTYFFGEHGRGAYEVDLVERNKQTLGALAAATKS